MTFDHLGNEDEFPVGLFSELSEFLSYMSVVTENNGIGNKFGLDNLIFAFFIFGTVVAIVDEASTA